MNRRQFVAVLAIGSAGCLSGSPSAGNGTAGHEPTTERRTTTATAPGPSDTPNDTETTESTTDTETPEPPDLRAAPGECPEYGDSVIRVVCYDAAPDDAPIVMEPSRAALDLPGEMTFTLENGTDVRLDTNFYSARLDKRVDGEWYGIAPQMVPQPLTPLPAGESQTWTVSLSGDLPAESTVRSTESGGMDELAVGGLGGGRYAFGISGWFKSGNHKRQTAFAATIEVHGAPVELTTTDHVEDVAVDGTVLTARWTGGNADGEYARRATYTLERTDATPDARLITEQVLQSGPAGPAPLQDALALATEYDVGEVRLTGQTASSPPFGVQGRVFEYEGTAYAVSASETATETEE